MPCQNVNFHYTTFSEKNKFFAEKNKGQYTFFDSPA